MKRALAWKFSASCRAIVNERGGEREYAECCNGGAAWGWVLRPAPSCDAAPSRPRGNRKVAMAELSVPGRECGGRVALAAQLPSGRK